jgi:hypothetical protein
LGGTAVAHEDRGNTCAGKALQSGIQFSSLLTAEDSSEMADEDEGGGLFLPQAPGQNLVAILVEHGQA